MQGETFFTVSSRTTAAHLNGLVRSSWKPGPTNHEVIMSAAFDQQFGQFEFGLASQFQAFDKERLRLGDLLERLITIVKDLVAQLDLSKLSDEQKQAILKAIEGGYNTYIRPLDIPYIPNVVEPWVDEIVFNALMQASKKLLGVE